MPDDITPMASLTVVTPERTDRVVITDASDSLRAKVSLAEDLLALGTDHWAEIRSASSFVSGVTALGSVTAAVVDFDANVTGSAEVAGGPSSGVVLTADAANNRIIVPPKTKAFVEFAVNVASLAGTDNLIAKARLGGVDQQNTEGSASIALTTGSIPNPTVVTGSGFVSNTGSGAANLDLGIRTSVGALSVVFAQGFLRAKWVRTLP